MIMFYMLLAIACEVGWALAMKRSQGFTRLGPTAGTLLLYVLSVVFLALATRRMDVGVGYGIWAGSGVALVAVGGMLFFRERLTLLKVVCIGLIVAGIAGLHFGQKRGEIGDLSPGEGEALQSRSAPPDA